VWHSFHITVTISPGALSIFSNSDLCIKGLGILHFFMVTIRRRTRSVMYCNTNSSSDFTSYPFNIKDIASQSKIIKYVLDSASLNITFLSLLNFLLGFCLYFYNNFFYCRPWLSQYVLSAYMTSSPPLLLPPPTPPPPPPLADSDQWIIFYS
jgi:hypothetical protein